MNYDSIQINLSSVVTQQVRKSPRKSRLSKQIQSMIPPYVTANFPPSFITAGNIDPLLPHSKVLATALKKTGVTTDTLFYPDDYTPALNHEYQLNLDTKEGMNALDRMVKFSFEQTAK